MPNVVLLSAMHIRPEAEADIPGIRRVNVEAFANHPFSRQTEHLIVEELRRAGALSVSLVAVDEDGGVVGHIAFSPMKIDGRECSLMMVGPLAVLPHLQRQGTGSALVRAGLEAIRAMGAEGCALVGDPAFYTRLGFVNTEALRMEGVPQQYILAMFWSGQEMCGSIGHHPAFNVQPE